MPMKIEVKRGRKFGRQQWWFKIIDAGNGKVLASSEAYTNKQDAVDTARSIAASRPKVEVGD